MTSRNNNWKAKLREQLAAGLALTRRRRSASNANPQ
jgi:hypothetical protein